MYEFNHNAVNPGSQMEVARLARWLWQQAGSPPGRYREFWLKVAKAEAASVADKLEAGTNSRPVAPVPHSMDLARTSSAF